MFIKLTDRKNNKPVYVNHKYIGLVYSRRSQDGDITVIELVGLGTTIIKVSENVEDVMMVLQSVKE